MAKQSFKDSIYQQIANSQVQQVIKDQRDQDYKLAQDLIAQYQPTNDDITLAQNLIAQYQQPAPQPEPVVSQPQVPVLKKQTSPTKEEKLKAFSENYARQQQEESMLQSARSTAEKEAKREAAAKAGLNWINSKDFQNTAKQGKALQLKEQEEAKRKEANKVLENQLTGKPVLTDEQEELERQILNADRYVEDDPNKQPWNKRLLSKDQKNAVVQNTTPETVDRWLSPETKLTEREKGEAKAYASAELQKFNYGPNKQPLLNTPEERQHYADMVNLINKTNTVANFAEGVIKTPYNLADMVNDGARALGDQLGRVGAAVTDKFGVTEGATQRHNEETQAANDFFNQNEENMRQSFANAQTQNPLAYAGGQFAGQMGMYMLTNPVFDGIAEGAGISNALGKFFVNQGAQNAQDLVLDTAPLVRDLMQDGTMSDADKREVFNNVLLNALGNAAMGTVQEIPNIAQYVGGKIDARRAADEAFRENVRAGANRLSEVANDSLPVFNDADNIARNATKNVEQIPNLPDYVTGGPTGAYDVARNIEPEPVKDSVKSVKPEYVIDSITRKNRDGSKSTQYFAREKYSGQRVNPFLESDTPEDAIRVANNTFNFMMDTDEGFSQSVKEAWQKNGIIAPSDIEPKPVKEAVEEVAKRGPELSAETQEQIASDFEEIYNGMEDMRSIVESSGDAKIAEKYSKMQDAVWNYEKLVYNSDSLEEINKAKKAADAARQGFIRAAKKIDPNFKGSLTGTKLGNAEFRRTSTAPTGSALLDEIVDDMVKQDIENPNRFVKDANKADIPVNAPVNGNGELEIHTIHGRNGREIYQVVSREGDLLTPVEPGKTFNTKEEAEKAIDQYKTMAESISKPKSDINTSEPIEPGKYEIPDTPENAPKDVPPVDGMKERGTSKHIRNDGTPMKMEDVADEVVADFEDNPDMYRVLKNADTKAKAEKIYAESDNPEVEFRDMLRRHDPAALPLGQQLAKDYSAAGNHAAASQIYREMGEQLTKAGQFSQAAVINMMKNDPLTALNYAERQIDNLNVQGRKRFGNKWKDFSLTDAEKELFNNIKPGDEDAIRAAYDTIGERLGKEYPTSFMDKLLEARKIAMLFNVRTNVRNVLANVPTLGMRWMSDRVDAVGQNIAHLINPDIKVTQSLTGSGVQGRKLAKQVFESDKVQALVNGTAGKYEIPELKNSLVQNKQMYKGTPVSKWIDKVTNGGIQKVNEKFFGKKGVQSGLETIRNATYKMLDLGDSPFVKENFVERLGSYIKAQGIKNIDDIPEEAIQTAWEEAMKATYKDNSWAVQMLKGVKGGLEKIPGVGRAVSQAAIPFLQAPGNIAARMVDYSPVKATKGIGEIIAGAGKNDVEQVTKGIADAAKGLTGSGLILLGMGLHKAGIITGAYSDDKDQKAYEKQNGFKEYALHLGDKYFTYDWAQPFAEPLIVGTLLSEAITKSDEYNSDLLNYLGVDSPVANKALGVAGEGVKASVNSWFGASPLQGLQELMSGGYSGDDIAGNIKKVAMEDFAGAFVPSSVNAVAKSVDNTTRNTYDPSSSTATFVNQQIAKIPVLSETLPAKYDTWGNEMKNADNKAMAAASKFLIPGDYSYDKGDKIDQEIMRLYEGTNNAAVFPQVAPTNVGDKKLNNKEVSAFQKDMGQRSRALAEDLINNKGYSELEDTEKVEVLDSLYKVSKAITERDKFGKEPSNTYKKLVEVYDKAGKGKKGQKALVEEVLTKNTLNKYDVTDSESARQILEDHGEKWLEKYGKAKSRLNGSTSSKKIEGVLNTMSTLSKKDKAEMYSYLNPSATPGNNPYGYVPGINYDPKEDKAYQKAKAVITGMSPEKYYETYDKMDVNSNSSISQDELYQYFESNSDLQDAYIKQLWEAYGGYTNKDGKKKQLIKNADGSYTSSY